MRSILSHTFTAVLAFVTLTALAFSGEVVARQYTMMGTFVEIKVAAPTGREKAASKAIELAAEEMRALIDVVNWRNPKSDVARLTDQAGGDAIAIDPRLTRILLQAREVSKLSGGAFDVTIAPALKLWRFDPLDPVIPDDASLAKAVALVDYRALILDDRNNTARLEHKGMRIDLGAIAKGAVIDAAAAALHNSGFPNALVNAGGDVMAMGGTFGRPWALGVQDPRGRRDLPIGVVSLRNQAIATSGDYEKVIEIDGRRYHHILDPRDGRPVSKTASVTVIASNAQTADAWSTALFVLGPGEGLKVCERLENVEALFVDEDLKQRRSSGFPKMTPLDKE